MKNTVIYHSADFDGIFCREIAKKFLPSDNTEFIGWNFGDPLIPMPEGWVFILDLSPDCLAESKSLNKEQIFRIIWIDHHKTSIEKHSINIPGYRVDGVAACRLAWQWFTVDRLPDKQDYLERDVNEPLAVRLAGEYDIWDHRGDGDLEFQFGLRSEDQGVQWNTLLSVQGDYYVQTLIQNGGLIMRYQQKIDADTVKYRSFLVHWEGLTFLCLNTARANSLAFEAKDVPENGHDALMTFYYSGGGNWAVSMYHSKHRKDIDLSAIAKKYGGGGHKGACGFGCSTALPPFLAR